MPTTLNCHLEFKKTLPLLPLPVDSGATKSSSRQVWALVVEVVSWLVGSMHPFVPTCCLLTLYVKLPRAIHLFDSLLFKTSSTPLYVSSKSDRLKRKEPAGTPPRAVRTDFLIW